ncbi:MAG: GGDEF domain-containing protein [Anaerolineales bacterium]|nr:GGDEF domain-containing protein [Anaerolineales bacterium]
MKIIAWLEKRRSAFWIGVGVVFVLGVGAADALTGNRLSFSLFYILPIATVTWFCGRNWGLTFSAFSAAVWFAADAAGGQVYSPPPIRYWNAVIRLGFFVLVAVLLPALKALEHERELARTDPLTGAANRRHVIEAMDRELWRSQRSRRSFTIVYIDLDGFKAANDALGHRVGDDILRAVVRRGSGQLRKTDLMARIGGDEFLLLLPETDRAGSKKTVAKIQAALRNEMEKHHWPVTFSIGALTCRRASAASEELIKKADALMYSVKNSGKNAAAFEDFPGRDSRVRFGGK